MDVPQYVTVIAVIGCHGSLVLKSLTAYIYIYISCVHVFEGRQLQATWQRKVGGRIIEIFKVVF